jgi:hypothetical protein
MLPLVKINLWITFQKKATIIVGIALLLLVFSHMVALDRTQANLLDLWLLSLGGLFPQQPLLDFFGWIGFLVPLLLLLIHLSVTRGMDRFIFARIDTRTRWVLAKYLTAAIVALMYTGFYICLHFAAGLLFLAYPLQGGSLSTEMYAASFTKYVQEWTPFYGIWAAKLLLGMVAYAFSALTVLMLVSAEIVVAAVAFTLYLVSSAFLYRQHDYPSSLTPALYPSMMDVYLPQKLDTLSVWWHIGFIIALVVLCSLIGVVVCRKKNLKIW